MKEQYFTSDRWAGHEEDYQTYLFMFDEAMDMIGKDEREQGALVMALLNDWERTPRLVSMVVLSRMLDLCEYNKKLREMADEMKPLFLEPLR